GRGRGNRGPPTGPNQCHDITVYPEVGLAGGACAGLGLLLDIRDAAHPQRVDFVADPNMSFWHSATFSNDGKKILFSDEWGGGSAPRCRDTDKMEWGADALFTIEQNKMKFHSYYKMPAPQTVNENCVAHNGSLITIPGREVMVQAWYQGGLSVFDWTDVAHPKEIAFFDRGPVNAERLGSGGSWSGYWYNGVIVSSEIARGLDIYELVPSPLLSQNEIDAAKTVKFTYFNTQDQQKFVWPPSFAWARADLDQLERSNGLAAETIRSARTALSAAEKRSGAQRKTDLTQLASQLDAAAGAAGDQAKVKLLSAAVTELANAQRQDTWSVRTSRLALHLRARRVAVPRAERLHFAGGGLEAMPPDTGGVGGEQVNRDRRHVRQRPHVVDVVHRRQQRVELPFYHLRRA